MKTPTFSPLNEYGFKPESRAENIPLFENIQTYWPYISYTRACWTLTCVHNRLERRFQYFSIEHVVTFCKNMANSEESRVVIFQTRVFAGCTGYGSFVDWNVGKYSRNRILSSFYTAEMYQRWNLTNLVSKYLKIRLKNGFCQFLAPYSADHYTY